MDNKEIKVTIVGIIVVAVLMFFAGMTYSDNKATQAALKGNICTPYSLCPTAKEAIKHLRDYQIELFNDSTQLWDGDRHVATLRYDSTQALDKVINADNE